MKRVIRHLRLREKALLMVTRSVTSFVNRAVIHSVLFPRAHWKRILPFLLLSEAVAMTAFILFFLPRF